MLGHVDSVREILKHPSVDVNAIEPGRFDSALSSAASEGRTDVVKLLMTVEGIDVSRLESVPMNSS